MGGGDKTKNDLTPQEQDGSDLTRLCQSVHTSVWSHSSTFEQSRQWNPVNTEWYGRKNQAWFKTQQHNCRCITLQQQHCFNKKAKQQDLFATWSHNIYVPGCTF